MSIIAAAAAIAAGCATYAGERKIRQSYRNKKRDRYQAALWRQQQRQQIAARGNAAINAAQAQRSVDQTSLSRMVAAAVAEALTEYSEGPQHVEADVVHPGDLG